MPKENDNMILENKIANRVIGISIDLHRALGPGLLESANKECIMKLRRRAILWRGSLKN